MNAVFATAFERVVFEGPTHWEEVVIFKTLAHRSIIDLVVCRYEVGVCGSGDSLLGRGSYLSSR